MQVKTFLFVKFSYLKRKVGTKISQTEEISFSIKVYFINKSLLRYKDMFLLIYVCISIFKKIVCSSKYICIRFNVRWWSNCVIPKNYVSGGFTTILFSVCVCENRFGWRSKEVDRRSERNKRQCKFRVFVKVVLKERSQQKLSVVIISRSKEYFCYKKKMVMVS